MAQNQIVGLEHETNNLRNNTTNLQHQLFASQQTNASMNSRNKEILSVNVSRFFHL